MLLRHDFLQAIQLNPSILEYLQLYSGIDGLSCSTTRYSTERNSSMSVAASRGGSCSKPEEPLSPSLPRAGRASFTERAAAAISQVSKHIYVKSLYPLKVKQTHAA